MTPPNPSAQPFVVRWHQDQSWSVEYTRWAPSPAKSTSPGPPRPQRSVWRYHVVKIDAKRDIAQLLAMEEGGDHSFELLFESLHLRHVVKIINDRRIDLIAHAKPEPYFGWSTDYPVIFDWPDFPTVRENGTRQFVDDEGQPVEESWKFAAPNQFEVRMTLQREVDAGFRETRRSSQVWVEGSPWWSTAEIETERKIDGDESVEINIRGRLMS